MHKFFHQFRRNRTYASHERWGVVGMLLLVTLAVTAGGWLLFGEPAASASSLAVVKIDVPKDALPIGNNPTGEVIITVANKETQIPAAGIWLGLRIANPTLRTPEFTFFDWYSPVPDRSFFQTDEQGQLKLPLISQVAGVIEYQIYAANPERSDDGKYQSLESSFTVNYMEQ